MVSIQLVNNAQKIVQSEFDKKEFTALQIMANEGAAKNFNTQFVSAIQNLIYKVGLILSQIISNGPKMSSCTCFGAIKYFSVILNDKKIESTFDALEINKEGNFTKKIVKNLPVKNGKILWEESGLSLLIVY